MWMIVLDLTIEHVWGVVDARGWGFKGLFGETPFLGLFINGVVLNTTLRI
jgi:hypothetical protein